MELLKSKKFKLPTIYFITDREDIKELPAGVPFIYGDPSIKNSVIRVLEFEIIYERAVSTGLPFNFKQLLEDAGFKDLTDFWYVNTVYIDKATGEDFDSDKWFEEIKSSDKSSTLFREFITDSAAYVDIKRIKELNVFPVWLDKIEEAVRTNIHNFAVYNPNMYNKKLEGVYGSLDLTTPSRNLIIIDISGSIPKAVSTTCLILSKNLAETFYADLMITGSKTTLYPYEELHTLNVETIYEENGMDNDQVYFRKLVTEDVKEYKTAIVFGDNHHPGSNWRNEFNLKTSYISDKDGKDMCRWTVDKVISFHTTSNHDIAGYARWFTYKDVEYISDWVEYLD